MTEEYAKLLSKWQYQEPYNKYSFQDNKEELEQIMNGLHYAVTDEETGKLVGFFCIGWSAQVNCKRSQKIYHDESYSDLGLGLKPDLTDKGLGGDFTKKGVEFLRTLFPEDGVRLTVMEDNARAIKVYKKLGFKETASFKKKFFGREKYIVMCL
ncbi:MAG: GNAT family N-acetyltransferase [Clostridiales bacterium]|jgi:RimJ/RimL family protein N-acetyltransferase|nr:GNAT family N-acetyltransferase [Clostridiales bacterium]